MTQTMWCRYYTIKGKKHYDYFNLAFTRKECKRSFADDIKGLRPEYQEEAIKEATFEKVTVTIEPFQTYYTTLNKEG